MSETEVREYHRDIPPAPPPPSTPESTLYTATQELARLVLEADGAEPVIGG